MATLKDKKFNEEEEIIQAHVDLMIESFCIGEKKYLNLEPIHNDIVAVIYNLFDMNDYLFDIGIDNDAESDADIHDIAGEYEPQISKILYSISPKYQKFIDTKAVQLSGYDLDIRYSIIAIIQDVIEFRNSKGGKEP